MSGRGVVRCDQRAAFYRVRRSLAPALVLVIVLVTLWGLAA